MQAKNERTIKQIKRKLIDNKAMISKGNSIIIILVYIDEDKSKILDIVANSNFTAADNYITKELEHDLRLAIKECQQRIHKDDRWMYIN
jgi:hypothetical protein